MQINIIYTKEAWDKTLTELSPFDFFHTFEFHEISQANGEGTPLLFVANSTGGEALGCWPVLKRLIPDSEYFDFTSVYGYAGPLIKDGLDSGPILERIWDCMKDYGAISLFSRMHPLFENSISSVVHKGTHLSDVVIIDTKEPGDVLTHYRGSHRREIINAQKSGVSTIVDMNCEYFDDFSRIYFDTMKNLSATEYYFFSNQYLFSMKSAKDFKVIIILAEYEGKVIAASMFVLSKYIMQYYLSGTDHQYRKFAPSKAIISKAHELATSLGMKHLVLGGGVGSARDSLFKFKSGFSDVTRPFCVTKKIFNEKIYQELCTPTGTDSSSETYFPAYRSITGR